MAVPGVGVVYDDLPSGFVKEDVLDYIIRITPADTPAFNIFGDDEADEIFQVWLLEELSTRNDNAVAEGDVYAMTTGAIPVTRESNVQQIFKKEIRISRSSQRVARYGGVADQYARTLSNRLIEMKTDMERAIWQGCYSSGNSSTARRMRGIIGAISRGTNNHSNMSNASLTVDVLRDMLQETWTNGVRVTDVFSGADLKRRISQFTAGDTKYRDQNDVRLLDYVSVFESDFGVVRTHITRDLPSADASGGACIVALNRDMFTKAWLDRPFHKRTADVADSLDGVALGEFTLKYGSPNAGSWRFLDPK